MGKKNKISKTREEPTEEEMAEVQEAMLDAAENFFRMSPEEQRLAQINTEVAPSLQNISRLVEYWKDNGSLSDEEWYRLKIDANVFFTEAKRHEFSPEIIDRLFSFIQSRGAEVSADTVLAANEQLNCCIIDDWNKNHVRYICHQSKQEGQADPTTQKTPSEIDIEAFRLKCVLGIKPQEKIAEMLTAEHGEKANGSPYTQGDVSHMLRRATAFFKDKNVFPDIPDDPRAKAKPIDPNVINMGERTDGQAKQQRGRHDDDE